jgi:RecJ-like exonuclease
MSWQKCPACDATGMVTFYTRCTVCNGKKIISELTGDPPPEPEAKPARFCDIVRFTLKERMKDPQITIEEIEASWKNQQSTQIPTQNDSNIQSPES